MSQTHLRKNFIFGFRSLVGCWGKCDEWLKLHWQEFLLWIAIFELLLSTVILPFAILNGSGSWLKLDQMTHNLVNMDNLDLPSVPLYSVVLIIYFVGLSIGESVFSKYHRRGTFGREQLVTRSKILRMYMIVAPRLPLFNIVITLKYLTINPTHVDITSVSTLKQPMMLSLDWYSTYPEVAKSWDQLQVGNKCCGVHNYSDWFGLSSHEHDSFKPVSPKGVPDSCCNPLTVGCGRNVTNLENIYPTGCLKSLADHIENQIGTSAEKWEGGIYCSHAYYYCMLS